MNVSYSFHDVISFLAKHCWIAILIAVLIYYSYMFYGSCVIPLFIILAVILALAFIRKKNHPLLLACPSCKIYAVKKSDSPEDHPEYICPKCKQKIPAP